MAAFSMSFLGVFPSTYCLMGSFSPGAFSSPAVIGGTALARPDRLSLWIRVCLRNASSSRTNCSEPSTSTSTLPTLTFARNVSGTGYSIHRYRIKHCAAGTSGREPVSSPDRNRPGSLPPFNRLRVMKRYAGYMGNPNTFTHLLPRLINTPSYPLAMSEDSLSKLLVSKEEVNRELLAEVLSPYVKLSKDTSDVIYLPAFGKLTNAEKILVFLLAKKAAKSLGLPVEREEASPTEISRLTGVNYDSVKPTVSSLAKKRVLQKAGDSYFVANHAILNVKEMLVHKGGD